MYSEASSRGSEAIAEEIIKEEEKEEARKAETEIGSILNLPWRSQQQPLQPQLPQQQPQQQQPPLQQPGQQQQLEPEQEQLLQQLQQQRLRAASKLRRNAAAILLSAGNKATPFGEVNRSDDVLLQGLLKFVDQFSKPQTLNPKP